jgi:hypothetical protein
MLNPTTEPVVFRSFMDIREGEKGKRVVHAVSVGNKENIHYTYDLDNAALFQIWKGGFLNTTPMWNDRGDGSSKPLGSLTAFGIAPLLNVLSSATDAWSELDVTYRPRGYELDEFKLSDEIFLTNSGGNLFSSINLTDDILYFFLRHFRSATTQN